MSTPNVNDFSIPKDESTSCTINGQEVALKWHVNGNTINTTWYMGVQVFDFRRNKDGWLAALLQMERNKARTVLARVKDECMEKVGTIRGKRTKLAKIVTPDGDMMGHVVKVRFDDIDLEIVNNMSSTLRVVVSKKLGLYHNFLLCNFHIAHTSQHWKQSYNHTTLPAIQDEFRGIY